MRNPFFVDLMFLALQVLIALGLFIFMGAMPLLFVTFFATFILVYAMRTVIDFMEQKEPRE